MTASYLNLSAKIYAKFYYGFHNKVPSTISSSYIQAQFKASKSSANIYIADLKKIGFLDDDGNTTKLVHSWKMPETYAAACKEIRESVYPDELLDLAGTNPDQSVVKNWFKAEGMNDSIASQRAGFFCLLFVETPPERPDEVEKKKNKPTASKQSVAMPQAVEDVGDQVIQSNKPDGGLAAKPFNLSNDVNVNIQIHIGADATSEQIESIFLNMSKYLK